MWFGIVWMRWRSESVETVELLPLIQKALSPLALTAKEWLGLMPSWTLTRTTIPWCKCIRVATGRSITLTTYPWLNPGTFFVEVDGSVETLENDKSSTKNHETKVWNLPFIQAWPSVSHEILVSVFCVFSSFCDQYWVFLRPLALKVIQILACFAVGGWGWEQTPTASCLLAASSCSTTSRESVPLWHSFTQFLLCESLYVW